MFIIIFKEDIFSPKKYYGPFDTRQEARDHLQHLVIDRKVESLYIEPLQKIPALQNTTK